MQSIGTEPFVFYSTAHIVELTGRRARTLAELVEGIRRASLRTLFFHLVEARLRIGRCTNDLSCWLEKFWRADCGSPTPTETAGLTGSSRGRADTLVREPARKPYFPIDAGESPA